MCLSKFWTSQVNEIYFTFMSGGLMATVADSILLHAGLFFHRLYLSRLHGFPVVLSSRYVNLMEFKYCSSLKPVFFHRSWGRPRWIFNFLPSLPLKWLAFLETPVICEWLFGLWRLSMITAAGGLQCWDEQTLSRLGKCLWKHCLLISRIKSNVTFTTPVHEVRVVMTLFSAWLAT